MNGSPLRDACLLIVALALLAIPLWKLTNRPPVESGVVVIDDAPLVNAEGDVGALVMVRSAHPLAGGVVSYRGESYDLGSDGAEFEIAVPAEEAFDLTVSAEWSDETPETALLLIVQPDERPDIRRTLWGLGEVFEVMSLEIGGVE